jgi:hypothetical protein
MYGACTVTLTAVKIVFFQDTITRLQCNVRKETQLTIFVCVDKAQLRPRPPHC